VPKLQSAQQALLSVLNEDLPQIYQALGHDMITVCVVPRAKAESVYHRNQQLFRATVQMVISTIHGYADGTNYLRRHINNRTTHLNNKQIVNYTNDGDMPFPGITIATCEISPNVKGRDVLLIDDIYTPGVNIDEDAINALRNAGTNTVAFYAIGRAGQF
jgi:hypothetical protein